MLILMCRCLGKPVLSNMDEFSEKFQRGGGSFPIQKKCCKMFSIRKDNFLGWVIYDLKNL